VDGILNTVHPWSPATACRHAAELWPFLTSSPFLVSTAEPLRLASTTATFVHAPWAVGRPAAYGLRSDQGGTCDIREPTMKRSSKSIHLRARMAWKEAGCASAAMRYKGGTNGRGPPDWTATILESLARRLSSPCSLVAPRTPAPPRRDMDGRSGDPGVPRSSGVQRRRTFRGGRRVK